MKKTITLLQLMLIPFIILVGCKSPGASQRGTASKNGKNVCDQVIQYSSTKIRMKKDGQEVNAKMEITINPTTKLITTSADEPDEGTISFDTEIESIDCSFNSDLTKGEAIYKGYIKQENGSRTSTSIKIESKNGVLIASSADAQNEGEFDILIDNWKIVEP